MRRQVLEPEDNTCPANLEVAFIECQGLAAWIAAGPPCPSSAEVAPEKQLLKLQEPPSPSSNLVLALVDLVLGDRQEEKDGRVNG